MAQTGEVISEQPLGAAVLERFGAPYYHMHREDLVSLLVTSGTRCWCAPGNRSSGRSGCAKRPLVSSFRRRTKPSKRTSWWVPTVFTSTVREALWGAGSAALYWEHRVASAGTRGSAAAWAGAPGWHRLVGSGGESTSCTTTCAPASSSTAYAWWKRPVGRSSRGRSPANTPSCSKILPAGTRMCSS